LNCTCKYKGIHLVCKIHNIGTCLEAACPTSCLWYRPAKFFHRLHVIMHLYREQIFGVSKNCYSLKKCTRVNWRNIKLRQSMCVCSDIRICLLFNDLSIDKVYALTYVWTNTSPGKIKHSKKLSFR